MLKFSNLIRPLSKTFWNGHGRRIIKTAVSSQRCLSWKIQHQLTQCFHTSPTQMITAEKKAEWYSMVVDTKVMKEYMLFNKMMKEEACTASAIGRALKRNEERTKKQGKEPFENLDQAEKFHSDLTEKISLKKLRNDLFLRFRLAVTHIVEPKLSTKPEKIQEEAKGYHFVENREDIDRASDYSLFLKQLRFDVESGKLDSFFLGIGIENAREFFEICEFALKGDQEAYKHVFPFLNYYMEEELDKNFDAKCYYPFDRERILDLIGKIKYSDSMQKNCVKMLDYLFTCQN